MRHKVYKHRLRETMCQKMMAHPGLTFLHNDICGLNDQNEISINQYLQQTKTDIDFPNDV